MLAGLPDDQRAALLAAQAEGAMALDGVDEVRNLGVTAAQLHVCQSSDFRAVCKLAWDCLLYERQRMHGACCGTRTGSVPTWNV